MKKQTSKLENIFIEVEFLKDTTLRGEKFDWYMMDGPYSSFSIEYEKGDKTRFWVDKENPKSFRIFLDKKDEPMYNEGMNGSIGWVDNLLIRKDTIKILKSYEM